MNVNSLKKNEEAVEKIMKKKIMSPALEYSVNDWEWSRLW